MLFCHLYGHNRNLNISFFLGGGSGGEMIMLLIIVTYRELSPPLTPDYPPPTSPNYAVLYAYSYGNQGNHDIRKDFPLFNYATHITPFRPFFSS